MKKLFSIFIIFVVWCVFWASPLFFNGNTNQYLPVEDNGYYIADYDVDIIVDEDKTLHITEKITANLLESSRGIVRYLPIEQQVSFFDNNDNLVSKNYKNKIDKFKYDKVNSSTGTSLVSVEEVDGYVFYRMGRASKTTGLQTYCFSYDFNVGDDRISDKDLFYFNIIGTGWDTEILNVDFSITFPTKISSEDFKLYVGEYGEIVENDSRLSYVLSENTLSGNVKNLEYGEAVTVYNEFEEGYFKLVRNYIYDILILIFALIILGGILIYFIKKRRKSPIVEVVEFSAPEGLTPTEVGYINDGKLSGDEISALVVYWASKGFVKLKQENESVVKITKIKDLPNNAKHHEKLFFNGLFANRKEVLSDNLNFSDPSIGYKIKNSVEEESKHIFDKKADVFYNLIVLFIVSIFGCLVLKNYYQAFFGGLKLFLGVFFVVLCGLGLLFYSSVIKSKDKLTRKKYFFKSLFNLLIIFGGAIGLMFFIEPYSDAFGARFYLVALLVAVVLVYPNIERYSEAGKLLLGKIRGLKNYILVAEKDRIEVLAKENPELFFEILPYAYVLGVSEQFMKKFEDVEIAQPSWYECDTFTTIYFTHRMFRNLSVMASVIRSNMINHNVSKVVSTVSKFSSGSGRSSGGGGGFSGGGSGGGGGGRW